jgi:structural maintenance of chromosome 1
MALQSLSLQSDHYMDYTLNEEPSKPSSQDLSTIRLRHIKSLRVCNFKSFAGEQYVGPFTTFTGVLGPNGGGKSNILDAIAFALGLSIRDLRCS